MKQYNKKTRYICLTVADAIKILDDTKNEEMKNKIKSQVDNINKKPFDKKEYYRQYYMAHRDEIRAQQKKYKMKMTSEEYEHYLAKQKEYRDKRKNEKLQELQKNKRKKPLQSMSTNRRDKKR